MECYLNVIVHVSNKIIAICTFDIIGPPIILLSSKFKLISFYKNINTNKHISTNSNSMKISQFEYICISMNIKSDCVYIHMQGV